MREEVAKRRPAGDRAGADRPGDRQQVGEGSGGRKQETRSDGTTGTTGGAGPGTAPPGYSDAQQKFAKEATKLRKGQDKK